MSLQAIGVSLIAILISGAILYHFLIVHDNPNEPPLVKGPIPILGCALALQRDFKSFLFRNRARHGDIFSIYIVGKRMHVISDPIDGIPTHFRNKAFRLDEFASLIRRKQFLNTEEELEHPAVPPAPRAMSRSALTWAIDGFDGLGISRDRPPKNRGLVIIQRISTYSASPYQG